jgi:hypothetical protein
VRTATTIFQWLVRVTGLVQLALGLLFWTGSQLQLIPIHMLNGVLVVLGLWVLAGLAAAARVDLRWVALAAVWGVVTIVLGMSQATLLPGDLHWVVQVLHLLVGLGAIGQAESLARRTRARLGAAPSGAVVGGAV